MQTWNTVGGNKKDGKQLRVMINKMNSVIFSFIHCQTQFKRYKLSITREFPLLSAKCKYFTSFAYVLTHAKGRTLDLYKIENFKWSKF